MSGATAIRKFINPDAGYEIQALYRGVKIDLIFWGKVTTESETVLRNRLTDALQKAAG